MFSLLGYLDCDICYKKVGSQFLSMGYDTQNSTLGLEVRILSRQKKFVNFISLTNLQGSPENVSVLME